MADDPVEATTPIRVWRYRVRAMSAERKAIKENTLLRNIVQTQHYFVLSMLVTLCCLLGRSATAQDVWDLAIEDLPPLDFPDASAGESKAGSVPPYRLPLPEGTNSESENGSEASAAFESPNSADAAEGSAEPMPATEGEENGDWLSAEGIAEGIYNEPEDYQLRDFLAPVFSSSDWYRNGHWYVDTTAAGIWRSSGKPKVLAKDLSGLETGVLTPPFNPLPLVSTPVNQITTRHKGFRFEPGLGLTVGRFLGRDYFNRDASVEFGFLGLFDWDTDPIHSTWIHQLRNNPPQDTNDDEIS